MSVPTPPRLADRVASWLLRATEAERLLDDLHEEYAEFQRTTRGRLSADLWYWRQVLGSAWALRARRIRPGDIRSMGRGGSMGLDDVMRDLRQAVRGLRRAPTFTGASVLTLGLGIGATTAIFSVVNAVLLRSLPYDEPERIVRAWDHTRDGEITDFSFRVVEYRELRTRTDVFEAVGAEFPISATVLIDGLEPRQVQGRRVTSDLFRVFGVEPQLGRMFTHEEVEAADRLLAVVSHGFWSRYLSADPEAVGRVVSVEGRDFTILGVLPEGYTHVSGADAQLFIPYSIGTSGWTAHWLDIYGLVRPGVSIERAEEEVNSALRAVAGSDRRGDRWFATVETLHDMVVGDVRTPMWAVFGCVALVLLLACVNVANLTLARSTSRAHELALRRSLGAHHGRILRHLLVENLLVAGAGGVLGILVAWGSLGALVGLAPPSIPRIGETRIDLVVLAFSLAVSAATTLVFGLGPALRMTRTGTGAEALWGGRGDTGTGSFHRLLGGLVVSEVALALTLLASAGLTVRTLQHLQREDLGFDRAGALTFRINAPAARYPDAADTHAFYTRLRQELGALPGVLAVGAGTDLPVSGEGAVATVTSEERFLAGSEEGVTVLQRRATEGLFAALGTPVLSGRAFDARDRDDGDAVVIISESVSRALYGDEDPVGRRIGWGNIPEAHDWMTIVGVVGDVRYETIERASDPQIYQAHAQSATREMALVIRTAGDPMAMLEPAQGVLQSLDPEIPIYSAGTLGGLVDVALASRRFTTTLFGLFAVVALALTVAGLYGVLAFAVGQRRMEIGVRMAVGASGYGVARHVLGRGLQLIGWGLAAGVLGAIAAGRLMGGLLVGVPTFDPGTIALVGTILVAVGIVACLAPALGASRVDPVEALREQ